MKKHLLALIASSTLFLACGDNSSTGPSNDEEINFFQVFPDQKTFVTITTHTQNACVVDTVNKTAEWQKVTSWPDTNAYAYELHNDTLVLYPILTRYFNFKNGTYTSSYDNEKCEGQMYIGQKSTSLYGKWKGIPGCYDVTRGALIDDEDLEFDWPEVYLSITESSFVTDTTYSVTPFKKLAITDDYSESLFRFYLYDFLTEHQRDPFYPRSLLYSYDWSDETFRHGGFGSYSLYNYGVTIVNQTKNSETFTIGDRTYKVNVTQRKAEGNIRQHGNGGYAFEKEKGALSVVSEDITCSLTYEYKSNISKDLCIDENINNFEIGRGYTIQGDRILYVEGYETGNVKAFEECLNNIKPQILDDEE
ncbi:MAG: hypothetical protein SPL52_03240 [Fibrobacter sp.]|nr:hypothetical protein [Fibrobacter sp.]